MNNTAVQRQQEYTNHLINILSPLVYEGLQSIYSEASKLVNDNPADILKYFQTSLKSIPTWNTETITNETKRIMTSSKSESWLPDLVRATLKSTISVLIENNSCNNKNNIINKNNKIIDSSYYKNIQIEQVIHKIYIECARELWNNPYLMYHDYRPIDVKRNQRDTIHIIKDCIKDAIRKLLPIKDILEIYLGEELEENNDSETEKRNIQKLIGKEMSDNISTNIEQFGGHSIDATYTKDSRDSINASYTKDSNDVISSYNNNTQDKNGDTNNSTYDTKYTKSDEKNTQETYVKDNSKKDLSNKILEILHNSSDKKHNLKGGGEHEKKIPSKNPSRNHSRNPSRNHSESDLDTSLSYKPEKSEKNYQEVFTNKNNQKNNNSKSGKTFFNKYLNI
jgi:hypothetical protein